MTQWVAIVTYSANGRNQVKCRFDVRVRAQYCDAGAGGGQFSLASSDHTMQVSAPTWMGALSTRWSSNQAVRLEPKCKEQRIRANYRSDTMVHERRVKHAYMLCTENTPRFRGIEDGEKRIKHVCA